MSKKELEYKAEMSLADVRGYLETFLAGLNEGTICVRKGDECLVLSPAETVKLEVEAREKKDKGKFGFEISWKREDGTSGEELTDSTGRPEKEEEKSRTEEPTEKE